MAAQYNVASGHTAAAAVRYCKTRPPRMHALTSLLISCGMDYCPMLPIVR